MELHFWVTENKTLFQKGYDCAGGKKGSFA